MAISNSFLMLFVCLPEGTPKSSIFRGCSIINPSIVGILIWLICMEVSFHLQLRPRAAFVKDRWPVKIVDFDGLTRTVYIDFQPENHHESSVFWYSSWQGLCQLEGTIGHHSAIVFFGLSWEAFRHHDLRPSCVQHAATFCIAKWRLLWASSNKSDRSLFWREFFAQGMPQESKKTSALRTFRS